MHPVRLSCYLHPFKIHAATLKKHVVCLRLALGVATILTKGKEGRFDGLTAFFAMGGHVTTIILTKSR